MLVTFHKLNAFHVVAKLEIQYRHGVRIGDVLRFETVVEGRSRHSFSMKQKAFIKASQKLAVEALVINVMVDELGRIREIDGELLSVWSDLVDAR